jgi:hypothetical protein
LLHNEIHDLGSERLSAHRSYRTQRSIAVF